MKKSQTGYHGNATGQDAQSVIAAMIGRFTDEQIAATLNRLRLRTGTGKNWSEGRVKSYRAYRSLPAFDPESADPDVLTLEQAARRLDVSSTVVRRLIADGTLQATQAIKCAPWEIPAAGLASDEVQSEISQIRGRSARPRTPDGGDKNLTIPGV